MLQVIVSWVGWHCLCAPCTLPQAEQGHQLWWSPAGSRQSHAGKWQCNRKKIKWVPKRAPWGSRQPGATASSCVRIQMYEDPAVQGPGCAQAAASQDPAVHGFSCTGIQLRAAPAVLAPIAQIPAACPRGTCPFVHIPAVCAAPCSGLGSADGAVQLCTAVCTEQAELRLLRGRGSTAWGAPG